MGTIVAAHMVSIFLLAPLAAPLLVPGYIVIGVLGTAWVRRGTRTADTTPTGGMDTLNAMLERRSG